VVEEVSGEPLRRRSWWTAPLKTAAKTCRLACQPGLNNAFGLKDSGAEAVAVVRFLGSHGMAAFVARPVSAAVGAA